MDDEYIVFFPVDTPHAGTERKGTFSHKKTFHVAGAEHSIVHSTFLANGFKEAPPTECDFLWANAIPAASLLRLGDQHRLNHFPRSGELTRKDLLWINIQRMQRLHGRGHFDMVPQTFVLPGEFTQFYAHWTRAHGTWIFKPAASSQGRGIRLVAHPSEAALCTGVVSRYIPDPMLVDGFKARTLTCHKLTKDH